VVARTWLHRLAWLQATKPAGREVVPADVEEARANFQVSCLRLAGHYVQCPARRRHGLALPYFRLSGLPCLEVLRLLPLGPPMPPGTLHCIEELVLRPASGQQEALTADVAEQVISMLGLHDLPALVGLLLACPALRALQPRQSLDHLQRSLAQAGPEPGAAQAVVAVLVGGPGSWLALVPAVPLSAALLAHPYLLFEEPGLSAFGLEVRLHTPVVFVEVLVSLVQSGTATLGQLLRLLLAGIVSSVTSPGDSVESAGILQLFLETYFIELVGEGGSAKLDSDQQQVCSQSAPLLVPVSVFVSAVRETGIRRAA
jgi:hypothetical protein